MLKKIVAVALLLVAVQGWALDDESIYWRPEEGKSYTVTLSLGDFYDDDFKKFFIDFNRSLIKLPAYAKNEAVENLLEYTGLDYFFDDDYNSKEIEWSYNRLETHLEGYDWKAYTMTDGEQTMVLATQDIDTDDFFERYDYKGFKGPLLVMFYLE